MKIAEELTHLPAQPIAAVEVLRLINDPGASAADLGAVVDLDPVLSARVLRLANAPHYGLPGSVASASRAVVLLGFATVRAIAASAASGLLAEHADFGPADYWAHSVSVAAAASVLAPHLRLARADAFSAGLLHDVGAALLHRSDTARYLQACEAGPAGLLRAEADLFGTTHAEAGAAALEAWRLPPRLVRAVANHHRPIDRGTDPLSKAIAVGEALAAAVEELGSAEPRCSLDHGLSVLGLDRRARRGLIAETAAEIDRAARLVQGAP